MTRSLRLLGAAALACLSVPVVGVSSAAAETVSKKATNYGYFNAAGIEKPDASPQDVPNVTSEQADGVPAGHLAVSASGGQESKVSFLYFDLFDLDPTSTVQKALLRVPTVPSAPPGTLVYQDAPERVAACKAGAQGFSEDDGSGLTVAPERLCTDFKAVGKASADGKAYEFDVTKLAGEWITGVNDGVALTVADAAQSSNFQVVFDKAAAATLALTYSGGTVLAPEVPVDLPPAVSVAPPVDFGGGSVPSTGFAPVPETSVVAPEVSSVVPEVASPQAPLTAAPATVPAAASTPVSMRPTAGFWIAGGVLGGLLALLALVLGDSSVPLVSRSTSRLSTALASPQRASSLRTRTV